MVVERSKWEFLGAYRIAIVAKQKNMGSRGGLSTQIDLQLQVLVELSKRQAAGMNGRST
jgi:hypothetical protein